jgi:NAD(P)-dependent dehydrogenase (short-subunit alcohol dehydrogenase family)
VSLPLDGTTAVVTGASRGIGRAIAIKLAVELGAEIALWARDMSALRAVAGEISAKRGKARAIVVDVTDADAVNRAAELVRATMPPLRVLVNNAGAVLRKTTENISDAEWKKVIATNLDGTFFVTRAFIAQLQHSSGRVINIASRSGREGTSLLAAYCAAKHAVVGLTRALAEELRAAKVSVNAICPGSVDTQMLREGMPGGRPDMSPEDVARTAVFLAHAAPNALTGACIDVYG